MINVFGEESWRLLKIGPCYEDFSEEHFMKPIVTNCNNSGV